MRSLSTRFHDRSAVALGKRDNGVKRARARFRRTREAHNELVELRDRLLEKYKDELPPPDVSDLAFFAPLHLMGFLIKKEDAIVARGEDPTETLGCHPEQRLKQRSEAEALEAAAMDLIGLDRYERRAQARGNWAIRAFMNLNLLKHGRLSEGAAWQNEPNIR